METKRMTAQSGMTNYMPLPRGLLELHLPVTAMLLYAMLLDRGTWSQKHDYSDFGGWIYVVYPVRELADTLRISDSTVKSNLGILENHGLIRKIRRSRREANRIFLSLPEDTWTAGPTAGEQTSDSQKTGVLRAGKSPPNNRKKQHNINNSYQHEEGESL